MSARTRLTSAEFSELQRRRQASAEAAAKGRAHRALPLALVEERARASRVAWADQRTACTLAERFPQCDGACEAGRSHCQCREFEAGSAVSEFLADPPRRKREPYPWRQLGAGLLVMLMALLCVHVIATSKNPPQQVAKQ